MAAVGPPDWPTMTFLFSMPIVIILLIKMKILSY
jgi:hypothetical protein